MKQSSKVLHQTDRKRNPVIEHSPACFNLPLEAALLIADLEDIKWELFDKE